MIEGDIMTNKARQAIIKQQLLNQPLSPQVFMDVLNLTKAELTKYASGKAFFEEPKYLLFLAELNIDKFSIGYVEPKNETPLQTPLDLIRPLKPTRNEPITAIKKGLFNLRTHMSKEYQVETLKLHLFEKNFGDTVPYLYKRIFIVMALVLLFNNLLPHIGIINFVVLGFSIPFTLMILIYELDRHDQLNLMDVLKLFVVGGMLSIGITYLIRSLTGYPEGLVGDLMTGLVEESAKLITCMILVRQTKFRNVYTAFVFGFVVGAGFDVFETMDYGFNTMISLESAVSGMETLATRSLFALGIGHHFWTGIIFATLVGLSKTINIDYKKLYHPTFIAVFGFIALYHAFFNFSDFYVQIALAVIGALLFNYVGYQFYIKRNHLTLASEVNIQDANDFYFS